MMQKNSNKSGLQKKEVLHQIIAAYISYQFKKEYLKANEVAGKDLIEISKLCFGTGKRHISFPRKIVSELGKGSSAYQGTLETMNKIILDYATKEKIK